MSGCLQRLAHPARRGYFFSAVWALRWLALHQDMGISRLHIQALRSLCLIPLTSVTSLEILAIISLRHGFLSRVFQRLCSAPPGAIRTQSRTHASGPGLTIFFLMWVLPSACTDSALHIIARTLIGKLAITLSENVIFRVCLFLREFTPQGNTSTLSGGSNTDEGNGAKRKMIKQRRKPGDFLKESQNNFLAEMR